MSDRAEFRRHSEELTHLKGLGALLAWDQETMMPPKGARLRAKQRATVAGIYHEKLTAPELGKLLDRLEESELDNFERASLKELKREHKKAVCLPQKLVKELVEVTALAYEKWVEAKRNSDFSVFAEWLERIVDLKRQEARHLEVSDSLYETLLDEFEPDFKVEELDRLFVPLREYLTDLTARIQASPIEPVSLKGNFSEIQQEKLGRDILSAMGFDWQSGRLDRSPHPFCVGLTPEDVRITTRYSRTGFTSALFGIIHEGGHALYEQGLESARYGLSACESISLGIHESQSRLWENLIGRSSSFWHYWYPRLRKSFPGNLDEMALDDFLLAINRVEPSPIRVEADEVTYGLHIIMRYEIERMLIRGETSINSLPGLWNSKMEEYLGITPTDDTEGVLQDTHWSQGLIGYFPTYLLGNLYAAQLLEKVREDVRDFDTQIRDGNLFPLRTWLAEKVHSRGRLYTAAELIQDVTGRHLSTEPFINYLEGKFGELYQLCETK